MLRFVAALAVIFSHSFTIRLDTETSGNLLFYLGVVFYAYRSHIKFTQIASLISVALFVILLAFKLDIVAMLLIFPYAFFWLCFGTKRKFSSFAWHGEFSYGIYLWGWPLQQMFVLAWPGSMLPAANALNACELTILGSIVNYWIIDVLVKRFQKRRAIRCSEHESA